MRSRGTPGNRGCWKTPLEWAFWSFACGLQSSSRNYLEELERKVERLTRKLRVREQQQQQQHRLERGREPPQVCGLQQQLATAGRVTMVDLENLSPHGRRLLVISLPDGVNKLLVLFYYRPPRCLGIFKRPKAYFFLFSVQEVPYSSSPTTR